MGKIVVLYPIVKGIGFASSQRQSSDPEASCLIVRFVIPKDAYAQRRLDNIHNQLLNCIQPIVSAALASGFTRHELAAKKLTSVIDKYRYANYREMIYFMRDLKAKNVFNFSRSRLFTRISKSRRFLEIKSQNQLPGISDQEKFFDIEEKHLEENQLI